MDSGTDSVNRPERRRRRLMMLLDSFDGSDAEFARTIGTDPAYLSQIKNNKRPTFGDDIAARAEEAFRMPEGWLDQWLPDEGGTDGESPVDPLAALLHARVSKLPESVKIAILQLITTLAETSGSSSKDGSHRAA